MGVAPGRRARGKCAECSREKGPSFSLAGGAIHSFTKYLLGAYCVLGSGIDPGMEP